MKSLDLATAPDFEDSPGKGQQDSEKVRLAYLPYIRRLLPVQLLLCDIVFEVLCTVHVYGDVADGCKCVCG